MQRVPNFLEDYFMYKSDEELKIATDNLITLRVHEIYQTGIKPGAKPNEPVPQTSEMTLVTLYSNKLKTMMHDRCTYHCVMIDGLLSSLAFRRFVLAATEEKWRVYAIIQFIKHTQQDFLSHKTSANRTRIYPDHAAYVFRIRSAYLCGYDPRGQFRAKWLRDQAQLRAVLLPPPPPRRQPVARALKLEEVEVPLEQV